MLIISAALAPTAGMLLWKLIFVKKPTGGLIIRFGNNARAMIFPRLNPALLIRIACIVLSLVIFAVFSGMIPAPEEARSGSAIALMAIAIMVIGRNKTFLK